jgi:protein-S-isoprenylcysteine O-methyltransferase Ste14
MYGGIVYAAFFISFLYLAGFVGGDALAFLGLPLTVDAGGPVASSNGMAALINIGLLTLFGLQHTIMARPSFKKAWTQVVPKSVERSTYVLFTTIVLVLLFYQWRPMTDVIWNVEPGLWYTVLLGLFLLGYLLVLVTTFLINHFELFGLMQVWYRFQGKDLPEPKFVTPVFYKSIRHPLYLGWITFFWATPIMTAGHLLFAAIWTIYIFIAVGYEERDMVQLFGDRYRDYMAKVPMIIPFGSRKD